MSPEPPEILGRVEVGYFKVNSEGDSYYIPYCQYASDYVWFNERCAYNFRYEAEDYSWFEFRNSDEYTKFYTRHGRTRTYLVYTEVSIETVCKNQPHKNYWVLVKTLEQSVNHKQFHL